MIDKVKVYIALQQHGSLFYSMKSRVSLRECMYTHIDSIDQLPMIKF